MDSLTHRRISSRLPTVTTTSFSKGSFVVVEFDLNTRVGYFLGIVQTAEPDDTGLHSVHFPPSILFQEPTTMFLSTRVVRDGFARVHILSHTLPSPLHSSHRIPRVPICQCVKVEAH